MKLLIIGHSVEDHIHQNNEEKIKPGGIYYSVLGLSKIINADDEIHLVTALQKSNQHLFSDVYDKIYKIDINWVEEIPKVHLIIHESEERTECYEKIPQYLSINYSNLSGFAGILINMISGFDISLEQLTQIRKHFSGLIYLDVHTFSRGCDSNGERSFKQIENFSQWASSADIIQANELEVKTLFDCESELDIAAEVLKHGTKILIVTKSDKGACAYYKKDNIIERLIVPAEKININNKIGCGDVFGSILFYSYLKTNNLAKSLFNANYAAGQAVQTKNLIELKLLQDDLFFGKY